MKSYPHAPDMSVFQGNLKAASERLVLQGAVTPALLAGRNEDFFPLNAKWGLECGCYAYALEQQREIVLGFFRESIWSFQKVLEVNAPVNLSEVIAHLSLALILRDQALVQALGALPRERYTDPDMEFPESMFLAEEIQAALALQQADAATRVLENGIQALSNKKLPRVVREAVEPSLLIEKAIAERDQQGLTHAFQVRHESYAKRFSNPRIRNLADGALDVWGLGLGRLALDRGLSVDIQSVYLPLDLLVG